LAATDFTVRGGAADASIGGKQGYSERMALELHLPLIRLVDGTGGGGSVRTLTSTGRTYIPANPSWETVVAALSAIPVVGACMGSVAGLGAARVVTSHFSVMVKDTSQLFVAGPPVVAAGMGTQITKEELGGSQIHAHGSLAVDNEAESEEDAFDQIRRFLSYMPQNVWQMPNRADPSDDPKRWEDELLSIIPRNRRRPYNTRKLIQLVVDKGSYFEIGRFQGPSQITGLARLNGYPVAVLGNDPMMYGGGMDAPAYGEADALRRRRRHLSPSRRELCRPAGFRDRRRSRAGRNHPQRGNRDGGGLPIYSALGVDHGETRLRCRGRGAAEPLAVQHPRRLAIRRLGIAAD